MHTILSGFLSANLLPIGEDDEKLKLLEAASAELAKEIATTPLQAYRLALVGLDERVPATDPVHKKAADVIAGKWQTMTNKTGNAPVQVHRAVLLRGIEIAASSNADLRHAMTLIARDLGSQAIDGKARDAVATMLSSWESSVTEELNGIWVSTVDMSLPKLSAKIKKPQISKEELASAFGRAAGPHDKDSKPYPTPNPHWPNAGPPWSYEFGLRAADAVLAAVQAGARVYAEEMQEALREAVSGLSESVERMALRDAKAELLWLRASLYSPSARAGYASLDPTDVGLHAAIDVSRAVTKAAPPSVEFFLRDLVAGLTAKRVRLTDFFSLVGKKLVNLPEGKAIAAAEKMPAQGRRSWLDCALRGVHSAQFAEDSGVPSDHEDTVAEFTVRLYRDLHIRKLLWSPS